MWIPIVSKGDEDVDWKYGEEERVGYTSRSRLLLWYMEHVENFWKAKCPAELDLGTRFIASLMYFHDSFNHALEASSSGGCNLLTLEGFPIQSGHKNFHLTKNLICVLYEHQRGDGIYAVWIGRLTYFCSRPRKTRKMLENYWNLGESRIPSNYLFFRRWYMPHTGPGWISTNDLWHCMHCISWNTI